MIVSPLDNPTIFLAHPQLLQPKFQQRSSDLFRGFADDPCHLRRAVRACHCEASWFLGWWNKRHSMQVTLQWYISNTTEVNYHTCRLLWYHYIVHIPDMEHMGPRKKPIKPNYMYTYIYIYITSVSGETLLGTSGHAWLLPQVVYGFRFPNKVNICGITHPPVIKRGNWKSTIHGWYSHSNLHL